MTQPIILKKNNTPTKPGNYVWGNKGPFKGQRHVEAITVKMVLGELEFRNSKGEPRFPRECTNIYFSDELGPIEFEDEKPAKESDVRKVTLRQGDRFPEVELENGDMWSLGETLYGVMFGEIPPPGESREYYIVPAASAVEFELRMDRDGVTYLYTDQGIVSIDNYELEDVFGLRMLPGETRRVTCFVHPADEPKEDHLPDTTKKVEESDVQESSEPQRLRTGWYNKPGFGRHRVFENPPGSDWKYTIISDRTPGIKDECEDDYFEENGIEIHWHDEPSEVDMKTLVAICEHAYKQGQADGGPVGLGSVDFVEMVKEKLESISSVSKPGKPPVEIKPGQRWRLYGTKDSECKVIRVSDEFYGVTVNDVLQEFPDTASKADLQAWLNENAEPVPEETA